MSENQYMQLALELASKAVGRTTPNPPVGAVVVRNGEIVGQGFHPAAGQPHAEIYALEESAERAQGATLYVTLEPCNHQGRTGPCTEAIIAAGIERVVVGATDPNPEVSGTGIKRLAEAGIKITSGTLVDECRRLIAPFAKHITLGLPFVTLKMAMTLDGQTATSSGDSQWISNETSRQHVHLMRDQSDAIMVGIGTILADDPLLTTRLTEGGKDPIRIIVDSKLQIPESARVFDSASTAKVLVVTTEYADPAKLKKLQDSGVEVIVTPANEGRVDLLAMIQELGSRDIQSILLEGGATLAAEALRCQIVDRAAIFVAPKMLGGNDGRTLFSGPGCKQLKNAIRIKDMQVHHFDDDILIEGEIV